METRRNSRRVSRRQILQLGAATVAAGAFAVNSPSTSSADASPADPSTPGFAEQAQVTRVKDHEVDVLVLKTMDRRSAPIVGFPLVPRVGDLVTVSDRLPGYPLAAVPLCRWITGVPQQQRNHTMDIGGVVAADSPKLHGATGALSVCVLDTSLPTGQVLAVRSPSH